MSWMVGCGAAKFGPVCRQRFMMTYSVKHCFIEDLSKEVRGGVVNNERPFTDKTTCPILTSELQARLAMLKDTYDITLTLEQMTAMKIPNTPESITCYAWMHFYFDMVGDQIPNSNGEIHLEPVWIKDVYQEYKDCMFTSGSPTLQPTQFGMMWQTCFRHVTIREFKAVTGKCDTCARLSARRRELRDNEGRQHLTMLHMLHRTTYMGERLAYADRIMQALQSPRQYFSLISDGMAQNHCILPWCGNLTQITNGCAQHIQGCLAHGRGLTLFRTFHNISNCSSVQIHTFLLMLEDVHTREGKLPDTVYYQVDGGSENIAKVVLVLCELLIARGLTKKVVFTRLLVGHTHADIDAIFGRLWKALRDIHVSSAQAYRQKIIEHLSVFGSYTAKVVDLFVIPNYKTLLNMCVDPNFERYAKEEYTQLQWTFEAVPSNNDTYPFGCKTTYRAFCQDKVMEIVTDQDALLELRPRQVSVHTYPEKSDANPDGGCVCM